MKLYSGVISLSKNSRGIYGLDTSMGCGSGMAHTPGGCYGDCYAAKSAKIYGHDFTKTVLRYFKSEKHKRDIVLQISKIKMPFVRIGCSGDPSENWEHCLSIIKIISGCNKEIVIITRHWTLLTDEHLRYMATQNICINTSVSALDNDADRLKSLTQYNRIKQYCKSILRIVSCDFNLENQEGHRLYKIQSDLFKNPDTLDTVFRPGKNNPFVLSGVVNVRKGKFMNSMVLLSKYNRKTYTGKCSACKEMCGVRIENSKLTYNQKPGLIKQLKLL